MRVHDAWKSTNAHHNPFFFVFVFFALLEFYVCALSLSARASVRQNEARDKKESERNVK